MSERYWPTHEALMDLIDRINAAYDLVVESGGQVVGGLVYGSNGAVIKMALDLIKDLRLLKDWLALADSGRITPIGDYLYCDGMTGSLNWSDPSTTTLNNRYPLIVASRDGKEAVPQISNLSYKLVSLNKPPGESYRLINSYVNYLRVFIVGGVKYGAIFSTLPTNSERRITYGYESLSNLAPFFRIDSFGRATKLSFNDSWYRAPTPAETIAYGELPNPLLDSNSLPDPTGEITVVGSSIFYRGSDLFNYKIDLSAGTLTKLAKRSYSHPTSGYSFSADDFTAGATTPKLWGTLESGKLVGTMLGNAPSVGSPNYAATTTHFYYVKTDTPIYGFFDPVTHAQIPTPRLIGGPMNKAASWQNSTTKQILGLPNLSSGNVRVKDFQGYTGGVSTTNTRELLWLKDTAVSGGFKSLSAFFTTQVQSITAYNEIHDEELVMVVDAGKTRSTIGGLLVEHGGPLVEIYCGRINYGRNYLGLTTALQRFEALCLFNADLTLSSIIRTNVYKAYPGLVVTVGATYFNPSQFTNVAISHGKILYAHAYDRVELPVFEQGTKVEAYSSFTLLLFTTLISEAIKLRGLAFDTDGKAYLMLPKKAFVPSDGTTIGTNTAYSGVLARLTTAGVVDNSWEQNNGLELKQTAGKWYPNGWTARDYYPWAFLVENEFVFVGFAGGELGYTGGPLIKLNRINGRIV